MPAAREGKAVWYVVQTVGGQEMQVLALMGKLVDDALVQEAFIPTYEVMKRIKANGRSATRCCCPATCSW